MVNNLARSGTFLPFSTKKLKSLQILCNPHLEFHELLGVGGCSKRLAGDRLVLLAQRLVQVHVRLAHLDEDLSTQAVCALGQCPDQFVAVKLEHTQSDNLARVVDNVVRKLLEAHNLCFQLVERSLFRQEQLHFLVSLNGFIVTWGSCRHKNRQTTEQFLVTLFSSTASEETFLIRTNLLVDKELVFLKEFGVFLRRNELLLDDLFHCIFGR